MSGDLEEVASIPKPLDPKGFNPRAQLPYGLTIGHVQSAMQEFLDFLGLVNRTLYGKSLPRLESLLMPANFSSMVGEFMSVTIPKYCQTLAKNAYHNGHPDLLPKAMFPGDSILHTNEGIELKASRYLKGWQGHNPEECFLLVFVFDSSRPSDKAKRVAPRPFSFVKVVGAKLQTADWQFAGRSRTSRRTITASVLPSGHAKMEANWVYRDATLDPDALDFT